MMENAYLDINYKTSLQKRIHLCQQIIDASEQIKELKNWKKDIPPPSSAYGTVDEWIEAKTVFDNAKVMLPDIVDQEEIKKALSLNLITEEEAWEISKLREQELANAKTNKQKKSQNRSK